MTQLSTFGTPSDIDMLRCPRTHRALAWDGKACVLKSDGYRYPVAVVGTGIFADFRIDELSDEVRARQRIVYEAEDSRYLNQGAGDEVAFMRSFVQRRLGGRHRSKDRLFAESFEWLGLSEGGRVLEVGCNDGRFVNWLAASARCSGWGIDLSESAIRKAVRSGEGFGTRFHAADSTALPFASSTFDAAISFDVFEHLGHKAFARTLSECSRVLRPGGGLVAYVVSQRDQYTFHQTLRLMTDNRLGVDCGEGHDYENFISPDLFRETAEGCGLRVDVLRAYHGFWTLFAEEVLGNRIPTAAIRLLEWLDAPLTSREYGNGYLACCRKLS